MVIKKRQNYLFLWIKFLQITKNPAISKNSCIIVALLPAKEVLLIRASAARNSRGMPLSPEHQEQVCLLSLKTVYASRFHGIFSCHALSGKHAFSA
jgi:hypothetical protein